MGNEAATKFRIAMFSHAGGRDRNEDICASAEYGGIVCCVLADGAGGHHGGDVASELCVQTVLRELERRPDASPAALRHLLEDANHAVIQGQDSDAQLADMRSTLVLLLIDTVHRAAVWGHVGDSRLYLFRNGKLHVRTRDHSLVQAMILSGLLTEEEADGHPERNILISSVGTRDDFSPAMTETLFQLRDGDAFLLCSDGVWGSVKDSEMEDLLRRATSPDGWLERLSARVREQVKLGSDNYTALAFWFGEDSDFVCTIPA